MLLAADIGNTHSVFGLFDGDALRASWRLATRREGTSDELGVLLRAMFAETDLDYRDVGGMIACSVVPDLNGVLAATCRRYFDQEPLFVGPGVKTGMSILYENPHAVGADRIVNAVAASTRHGCPVIVLDFGTATTFDVVGESGEYLGGVIAPGVELSAEALFEKAARLPRVDVKQPARVIGRNTEEVMQSGLFHGYVALVEGLVARIRGELAVQAPVVATGGLAPVFASSLDFLEEVDLGLTLDGLRMIWQKNRR